MEAPFRVGERINQDQLRGWEYLGLSGKPGLDKDSVRRFKKGDWTLEVRAYKDPRAATRVVAIRTRAEDDHFWAETRTRLMRHRPRKS